MIAVVKTGGKQYLVEEGSILKIEKIPGEVGEQAVFSEVLARAENDGSNVSVGTPLVNGSSVQATILEQGRGKKISVIKYKPKVRYRRKVGHHQLFTKVKVTSV